MISKEKQKKLYDKSETQEAKAGDTRKFGDDEYESVGTKGTKKGGDRFKEEDSEGDLDEKEWDKAREYLQQNDPDVTLIEPPPPPP